MYYVSISEPNLTTSESGRESLKLHRPGPTALADAKRIQNVKIKLPFIKKM